MSREIKFRGKRLANGEWVFGDLCHNSLGEAKWIMPWGVGEPRFTNIYPDTVGQYTGLKDSKRTEEYPEGQEIYEGDIVKAIALSNDHHQRGAKMISAIEYWNGNACLAITYVPLFPIIVNHDIEVIGNIHDNPELLEKEEKQ